VITPRRVQFLIVLAGIILLLPSLFLRDLWKPDEPRYAQVAREMSETGEWIVPHLNGETYAHKPPLVFWIAGLLRGTGLEERGGRAVSMLAALGTMLLTAAFALRWFTPVTALLAPLILITCWEFGWMGRNGGLDAPLAFLTTFGVWAYVAGGRATPLLYIAAGLSVLVKGPVGPLFIVLGVVAMRIARVPVATKGWKHMLWGVPLTLAIVAAWVVPACLRGGEAYADELIFKQNVGRAVKSWSHKRPFYYYLGHLPEMVAPWILIAIPAALRAWQRRKREPALVALMLWFAFGFVIFTAISGKRTRYLLPIFPAFALVTARGIEAGYLAVLDRAKAVWFRRAAIAQQGLMLIVAGAMAILAIAGGWMLSFFEEQNPIVVRELAWVWEGSWRWFVLLAATGVGAIAFVGLRAAIADKARKACALLVLSACVAWIAGDFALLPVMDRLKSPRDITDRLDEEFPREGELVAFYHTHHAAYSIYADRLILPVFVRPRDVVDFLGVGEHRGVIVSEREITRYHYEGEGPSLADLLPDSLVVSELGRVGSNVLLLVSNFDPPDSMRANRIKLRK